jgi:hypothetical protein
MRGAGPAYGSDGLRKEPTAPVAADDQELGAFTFIYEYFGRGPKPNGHRQIRGPLVSERSIHGFLCQTGGSFLQFCRQLFISGFQMRRGIEIGHTNAGDDFQSSIEASGNALGKPEGV